MGDVPILPGFHPDPSICRVGEDFFLVTSSFEYAPGVPLFTSHDLVRWDQVGNVLDRPEQLRVRPGQAGADGGVYAPTLRHHDGRFFLTTTNIGDIGRGHLIVHAEHPGGPWSDPVYTGGVLGVDPDLAWDDDGTCYLTYSDPFGGIAQATVDPLTGELSSPPRPLWEGTGLAHPEGPHLYRRGPWWYLVVAEGGTGPGHAVSVARSASPTGPFESCPANPVLSHRSTGSPVQSTGHADLVELADGGWAMVHLGVRPRGSFPKYHVNGRETFLVGVDWVDDWPVVVEDRFAVPPAETSFADTFGGPALHPRWIAPGVQPRSFVQAAEGGGAHLLPGRAPADREAARLLAVRCRDAEWTATATVPHGDVALVVRLDDHHWAGLERVGGQVAVRVVIGPLDQVLAREDGVPLGAALAIRAVGTDGQAGFRKGPDRLELGLLEGGDLRVLTSVDGRYLSTEVAGGFTGRVVGVEALGSDALLTRFAYTGSVADPA
ncbi:family 43 glycosylhydrolase [Blastococcus sp. SYSU D00813]